MGSSENAQTLIERLTSTMPNLTQIRAIAKEVGKDQAIADYLWAHGDARSKLLALLILDLKGMTPQAIDSMISDIASIEGKDQVQITDWLIANVIMKKTVLKNAATTWRADQSIIKQRIFWSVQARTIKAENEELNTHLVESIEADIAGADETVQWNMNWCAAQIGIENDSLRERCIQLGERLGLYKDYPVPKGCTSPYLPIWITAMVERKDMQTA